MVIGPVLGELTTVLAEIVSCRSAFLMYPKVYAFVTYIIAEPA